ncbi:hypothetical protein DFJ74DRAFT_648151 [Hyaloraphidium curvatum]|nr:hypothetical protein DFJ74DRAFT_648151 [Hyaloraphidium curvatum]
MNAYFWPRLLGYTLPAIVAFCSPIGDMLSSGTFDAKGTAAGAAAYILVVLAHAVVIPRFVGPAVRAQRVLDDHPWAFFVRLDALRRGTSAAGTKPDLGEAPPPEAFLIRDAQLLHHEEGDAMCPCAGPACAGSVLRRSAALQSLVVALWLITGNLSYSLFNHWTPAVTFASQTWSSPWKALFVAYSIAANFADFVSGVLEVLSTDAAMLDLEARLRQRAVGLALSDFVSRCSRACRGGATAGAPQWPETEPYVALHGALAPSWRTSRIVTEATFRAMSLILLLVATLALIPLLASGCVPAYMIASCGGSVVIIFRYLMDAVYSNAGVASTAALYRRARLSLSTLLASHPDSPTAARLRSHVSLLARFETDCNEDRAKLAGFQAGWGTVRGAFATGLTLGVGLFGILRGAGARATLEGYCPVT